MCVHMNGVQEYLQAIAGCTSVCAKRFIFFDADGVSV
jgi:hypothetical protein